MLPLNSQPSLRRCISIICSSFGLQWLGWSTVRHLQLLGRIRGPSGSTPCCRIHGHRCTHWTVVQQLGTGLPGIRAAYFRKFWCAQCPPSNHYPYRLRHGLPGTLRIRSALELQQSCSLWQPTHWLELGYQEPCPLHLPFAGWEYDSTTHWTSERQLRQPTSHILYGHRQSSEYDQFCCHAGDTPQRYNHHSCCSGKQALSRPFEQFSSPALLRSILQ